MKWKSLVVLASLVSASQVKASSHREAPEIAKDPANDITDVYAFPAPDAPDEVVFVMNVSPGGLPDAAPNWYSFDEKSAYSFNIDTNGDGIADYIYSFNFKTQRDPKNGNVIAFPGKIVFNDKTERFEANPSAFRAELLQTYTVNRIRPIGNGKFSYAPVGKEYPVAPPRIGFGTTEDGDANDDVALYNSYKDLSQHAVMKANKFTFFAGPRNDPFYVDLGGIFDGLNVRIPPLKTGIPRDSLAGTNVLSIVMRVHKSAFLKPGENNFGVWASTHQYAVSGCLPNRPTCIYGGPLVQKNRLGNPLVNEVIIGMKDKDRWNKTQPSKDWEYYKDYFLNPQLGVLLNLLYGKEAGTKAKVLDPILTKNRNDLRLAFIDGIPGINRHPQANDNAGDMIRVNLALPPELQFWPVSGRRLKDDVVKSALTFLAQCEKITEGGIDHPLKGKQDLINALFGADAPNFKLAAANSINCALDDFVTADDKTPGGNGQMTTFPYLDLPFSAYGKKDCALYAQGQCK